MNALRQIIFPPFRLEPATGRLWHNGKSLTLRPKPWAVLCFLADRPGLLVDKNDLLACVWPDVEVTEASVTRAIRELRTVLDDDARCPKYIETVPRRGFRFIATLEGAETAAGQEIAEPLGATPATATKPTMVGRTDELSRLADLAERALSGYRQLVILSGEAGIGKTTLCRRFLAHLRQTSRPLRIAHGQCIEQYGTQEAFLPILEALGRLCRGSGGGDVVGRLRHMAPSWLVQMPGLLSPYDRQALRRELVGVTRERMVRVMTEALEAITARIPLVLLLEDLHWADAATVDLLRAVVLRPETARLMVLATSRPGETITFNRPFAALSADVAARGLGEMITLRRLERAAVAEYLDRRFDGALFPSELTALVHRQSDGNPLFMIALVDELLVRGRIIRVDGAWRCRPGAVEIAISETLRQIVERQLDRLKSEDVEVLRVASVAGADFPAQAVAGAVGATIECIETTCERLSRGHLFLTRMGTSEWPDGSAGARFEFSHFLYRSILYDGIPAGRRRDLHARIAAAIERGYGDQASVVAAELATHLERAGKSAPAVRYLEQSAANALQRSADREAVGCFERALERLAKLPATPERDADELRLRLSMGPPLMTARSYAATEVGQNFERALALCRSDDQIAQRLSALGGLAMFSLNSGKLARARALAEELGTIVEEMPVPAAMKAYVRSPLVLALFYQGELKAARAYLEKGLRRLRGGLPPVSPADAPVVWMDPEVTALGHLSAVLAVLGFADQARALSERAHRRSEVLGHPYMRVHALGFGEMLSVLLRDAEAARTFAEETLAVTESYGFPYWREFARIVYGRSLVEQGNVERGLEELRAGCAGVAAMGRPIGGIYARAIQADAYLQVGHTAGGLAAIDSAIAEAEDTGERVTAPELRRLRGELLLRKRSRSSRARHADRAAAEACFLQAIDLARHSEARLFELRATVSLARLWAGSDPGRARELLNPLVAWFREGADTLDLKEAVRLLSSLGVSPKRRRATPRAR